ncbi:MAG TPA: pyrroloquinoline quinone biosynthesis peptide chaperone PqqD [Rhodospirillaceae bacterium]|jgi:pyrroloquinoline quinone biosynthesis protein D|nr:pyrroloquinoline quinone biosynthesis peptide chaperone PqqD [Rhodospirillaceae bacterium]MDP6486195.1 pyrroloquinoline quinone biosynthesis peptide chaperone PqqD [Alphaproteobacteria bacterium]MDP6661273.1 pyrroloquinoline quinone biosynthesis peptide chaperone PqqD [Alphaproteobacteria bacterium]MDP6780766.1 pyrroloquinoline quinone biosynthesis peptide chaperone PqqD [Alphaproteobacteria bacterium]HAQ32579.1 pyrroloquinoline quinone biosynthesis peptide chaperone PqqD [Rhodospirillaceae 
MTDRVLIDEDSVPKLPVHVKLRFNEQREQWVVLAPERLLVPDETSLEILQHCDGEVSVSGIVDVLADKYDAPRETIGKDVMELLQGLADKGFIAT